MSVNYRKVESGKVSAEVLHERAKECEERAFVSEVELKRLSAVKDIDPNNGEVAELYYKQIDQAVKARRIAVRAAGGSPLKEGEILATRRAALDKWLEVIEQNHVAQTAMKNEAQRQLELSGRDALDEEEREAVQEDIKVTEKALLDTEASHGVIVNALDEVIARAEKLEKEAQEEFDRPAPPEVPHLEALDGG
jgi:hypothetical protein